MDISHNACPAICGKMAFSAIAIVQGRFLTVGTLPLMTPQTILSIIITGKILFAMDFDPNRRQPGQEPRIARLGRMTRPAGAGELVVMHRGGGMVFSLYAMPGMAGVTPDVYTQPFSTRSVPVFLIMTHAAIHIPRTALFHMGIIHNTGMTIHTRYFTIMNRIFVFPDRHVKRTFPTAFTVAIEALIRFVGVQVRRRQKKQRNHAPG